MIFFALIFKRVEGRERREIERNINVKKAHQLVGSYQSQGLNLQPG